jgi:hypothetical protein
MTTRTSEETTPTDAMQVDGLTVAGILTNTKHWHIRLRGAGIYQISASIPRNNRQDACPFTVGMECRMVMQSDFRAYVLPPNRECIACVYEMKW